MRNMVFAALLLCSTSCAADGLVRIDRGFGTGMGYLDMSENEQRAHASGIINGMLLSPLFGAKHSGKLGRLEECTVGMNDLQVSVILSSFLRNHPERWHEGINTTMYAAMVEACHLNQ